MPPAYLLGPELEAAPRRYLTGCTGKVPQTRLQARAVQQRRAGFDQVVHTYRCPACLWWHTSHLSGAAVRRREERLSNAGVVQSVGSGG